MMIFLVSVGIGSALVFLYLLFMPTKDDYASDFLSFQTRMVANDIDRSLERIRVMEEKAAEFERNMTTEERNKRDKEREYREKNPTIYDIMYGTIKVIRCLNFTHKDISVFTQLTIAVRAK